MHRWGTWWAVGCFAVIVIVGVTGESCRTALETSESCNGLSQFAYDGQAAIALVLVVVALVGAALLNALQRAVDY